MNCEYTHEPDNPCTGDATHTLHRHNKQKRVCAAAVTRINNNLGQPCITCRRPKWTHWDLFPIEPKAAA